MKTAIYIEDGVMQLVVTPESDFEKQCLGTFSDKDFETKIHDGSFYDCRGGWVRQSTYRAINDTFGDLSDSKDKSLILVSKAVTEEQ